MASEYKILGIEQRKNKNGGIYFYLHLGRAFKTEDEGIGMKVASEYVRADIMPADLAVNDTVRLEFERGYEDKAYLSDIVKIADTQTAPVQPPAAATSMKWVEQYIPENPEKTSEKPEKSGKK